VPPQRLKRLRATIQEKPELGRMVRHVDTGFTYNIEQRAARADLMQLLLQYKNQLLDRRTALLKLWGDDDMFNARSMDVYITRLRKFIRHDDALSIINVRGHGYTLVERV